MTSYPLIGRCPVCQTELEVVRLECRRCTTALEGRFQLGRWHTLSREQLEFAEIFIRNRGNLKEAGRELGISYPTVSNRLDGLIRALGYEPGPVPGPEEARPAEPPRPAAEPPGPVGPERRRQILEQVRRGELSAEEAARLLARGG